MKKRWIFILSSSLLNIFCLVLFRIWHNAAEFYSDKIYPVIVAIFARITGIFPFSVAEILLYLLILFVIFEIIFFIIKLIKDKKNWKRYLNIFISINLSVILTLGLMYQFGCGINYYREPFSTYSGLEIEPYSKKELEGTIKEVAAVLSSVSESISTDSKNVFIIEGDIRNIARSAMNKLSETYSVLETYYPKGKPIILSETIMSRTLIAGIFSPFTIEANYNRKMPESSKPFTLCHELSHLTGFMREDEANFIAFLACRESGDSEFIYSGYFKALGYLLNAYYDAASEDEYFEFYNSLPEQVKTEIIEGNEYWRKFRNTKISTAASNVNDAYLKANDQEEGVLTYNRFVDLLVADFKLRAMV